METITEKIKKENGEKFLKKEVEKKNYGRFLGSYNSVLKCYTERMLMGHNGQVRNFRGVEIICTKDEKEFFGNMESKKKWYLKGSCTDENGMKFNQLISGRRAESKLKQLIMENGLCYHWTLTYDKSGNGEKREKVLYDLKKFLLRIKSQLGMKKFSYAAALEIMEKRLKKYGDRVIHIHIGISEDLEEVDIFSAWNSIRCKKCKSFLTKRKNFKCQECKYFRSGVVYLKHEDITDIVKTANYLKKYLSKEFKDDRLKVRNANDKRYFRSSDLRFPRIEYKNFTARQKVKIRKFSEYNEKFEDGSRYFYIDKWSLKLALENGEKWPFRK